MPDIINLVQHLNTLKNNLNAYRPKCSGCGKTGLWGHGYYYRKLDRHNSNGESLNPIPIPRFLCNSCKKTTSVLPECIPPHRWYMWNIQQAVMLQIILGKSFRAVSQMSSVSRSTCKRWWNRFKSQYLCHGSILRNYYPELGYHTNFNDFWITCLRAVSLSKAMLLCNQFGVTIP